MSPDGVARRTGLASAQALACAAAAALLAAPVPAAAGCLPARQVFAVREAANVAFRQPSDLVLAGNRLLVLDDLNGRIALLDLTGRSLGSIPLPGGAGRSWLGIGFGGADQIFLAASAEGRVFVLDFKGTEVRDFPVGLAGESRPTGVLVSRGTCFVADPGGQKVLAFDLDGQEQASWGGLGEGPAQFRGPFRVAQDSLDRVFVSDALNSRVLVFTPRGEPLAVIGEFGTTEGTLFRPSGITVIEGDRLLVADNYFGSLQFFDGRGVYQGVLCGADGRPLALENPTGVAGRGSTVFVVEMGAGRVSAWDVGSR